MTKQERRHFLTALRRFENATRDDAFKGTVVNGGEEGLRCYQQIEREYQRSRELLIAFVEKRI